jgi:hypothetical protein
MKGVILKGVILKGVILKGVILKGVIHEGFGVVSLRLIHHFQMTVVIFSSGDMNISA